MPTIFQSLCLAATLVIMAGCTKPPAAVISHSPVYATDMIGKAAACTTSPITVKDGAVNPVSMTTGGGGWCGISLDRGGHAYAAGLLTKPASSGKVYIHTVGDETRIDYTASRVPVTPDSFTVRLIPGDATLVVSVAPTSAVSQ